MSDIVIVRCGAVSNAVLEAVAQAAAAAIPDGRVAVDERTIDPTFALDPKRRQYSSPLLLKRLIDLKSAGAFRAVGITEADLFIPMLTFVFGQAQVGGEAALVSAARLRQEFYRLAPDPPLLDKRVRKEVLHELGHTLSLVHCPDASCIMSLATGVQGVDRKSDDYCDSCRAVVRAAQTEIKR